MQKIMALLPIFFVSAILLLSGCTQPPQAGSLQIVLDKEKALQGETLNFSIKNNFSEPVFLPGCNEFGVESLDGSNWQELPALKQCVWEGNAVEIKPGETKQFSFLLAESAFTLGRFRVSVSASTGCTPGFPLSSANCKSSLTIKSHEFTVSVPSVEKMQSCTSDSDCILVDADCCGCNQGGERTAINKAFESEWRKYLSCETKDIACIQVISNDPSCNENNQAICTAGKCEIGYPL